MVDPFARKTRRSLQGHTGALLSAASDTHVTQPSSVNFQIPSTSVPLGSVSVQASGPYPLPMKVSLQWFGGATGLDGFVNSKS